MVSPALPSMRIPGWFLWPLLYAAATFSWIVFFEHGPGKDRFVNGAQLEITRAWDGIRGWWNRK